jgi:hypothetical protein
MEEHKKHNISEHDQKIVKALKHLYSQDRGWMRQIIPIINELREGVFDTEVDVTIIDDTLTNAKTKIPVGLIMLQSDVLSKHYEYDGKISIPKTTLDFINFQNTTITGRLIIDSLIQANKYNINIKNQINLHSLRMSDLIYYANKWHFEGIESHHLIQIRDIISIFTLQLMSPLTCDQADELLLCNKKCMDCQTCEKHYAISVPNHRHEIRDHYKSCAIYVLGVTIPKFINNVIMTIPYKKMMSIFYDKLQEPFIGSVFINTNPSNLNDKVIISKNQLPDKVSIILDMARLPSKG